MKIKVHLLGNSSLLLIWENKISDEIHQNVLQVQALLLQKFKIEILETVPSYQSLAVYFHQEFSASSYVNTIKKLANHTLDSTAKIKSTMYHIPVCYEEKYGSDLSRVLDFHQINHKALVEMHTSPLYKVYFLGFLPGFPYLGGLKKQLHTPRKENPSRRVIKGSVAIGGEQTGIYTTSSPGGWNVIGRSPLEFFNIKNLKPSLFQAGDCIQFYAISENEYQTIEEKIAQNAF